MIFHAAEVCVTSVCEASVVATTKAAATALIPAGAHSTTKTVRHEAIDEWIGAALHVRQQVRGQLLTAKRSPIRINCRPIAQGSPGASIPGVAGTITWEPNSGLLTYSFFIFIFILLIFHYLFFISFSLPNGTVLCFCCLVGVISCFWCNRLN